MESALLSAYKKNFDSKTNAKVSINRETGEIKIYSYRTVVEDIDEALDNEEIEYDIDAIISLEDAKKIEVKRQ